MAFLDLSSSSAPGGFVGSPQIQAGTHLVTLTTLKYVAKCDKALAEFTDEHGDVYQEWLGASTEGQTKRMGAFLSRLCALCSVSHPLKFDAMADFDKLGLTLVGKKTPLRIVLHDETWEGQTRVRFDGFFDHCILPGVEEEGAF